MTDINNNQKTYYNTYTILHTELQSGHPYVSELKLAIALAFQAGENMKEHLDTKGTKVAGAGAEARLGIRNKKNETDFATAIDIQNEQTIIAGIRETFPDHQIIGEESTGTGEVDALSQDSSTPTWIIDPIDGTTNFASGCPLTCVSIGFCVGGRPVLGVVFSPQTNELYIGVDGRGAYRNGERIVSTHDETKKTLANSVVCFEYGYARSEQGIDDMINAVRRVLKHGCRSLRTYGSGVLDLCYVASGRLDVVYTGIAEEGWKPWDYCAAMVICEESGCTMRSLKQQQQHEGNDDFDKEGHVLPNDNSKTFDIYSKSMICGVNKKVVEECRRIVLDL